MAKTKSGRPLGWHPDDDKIVDQLVGLGLEEKNPHSPYILRLPLHAVICGSTGTGKTYATLKCICLPVNSPFDFVIWCGPSHSNAQPELQVAKKTLDERAAEKNGYREGMFLIDVDGDIDEGAVNELIDNAHNEGLKTLVVFDDLAKSTQKVRDFMTSIFIHGRHRGCHAAELRQTIFDGPRARDLRMQASCFILTEFPQLDTITQLAKQIDPSGAKSLVEKYQRCVSKPHGFLLVDRTSKEPEWRYRDSGLNPTNWPQEKK
eukprot:m.216408 g.216408  ORF g.216408 m.216408 type:complete len:262 (-) comp46530_c0_seq1:495-1280(-)